MRLNASRALARSRSSLFVLYNSDIYYVVVVVVVVVFSFHGNYVA